MKYFHTAIEEISGGGWQRYHEGHYTAIAPLFETQALMHKVELIRALFLVTMFNVNGVKLLRHMLLELLEK